MPAVQCAAEADIPGPPQQPTDRRWLIAAAGIIILLVFVARGLGQLVGHDPTGRVGGTGSAGCNDAGAPATRVRIGDDLVRPLLGVNAGPVAEVNAPDDVFLVDLTEAFNDIGVRSVRTHDMYGPMDMSTLYPDRRVDPRDDGALQFEDSDRVWAEIVDGGLRPYLRLGDSWGTWCARQRDGERCCAETPERCGIGAAPPDPDGWVRAATAVVGRYAMGANGPGDVEIWNEPDNPAFWDPDLGHGEFFALFSDTAHALREAHPGLRIGGPGLTPAAALSEGGEDGARRSGRVFTRGFLTYLQRDDAPLDFLSWHMYSNDPEDFRHAAEFYRGLLDASGYPDATSHLTEWNLAQNDPVADDRAAATLTAIWITLQQSPVDDAWFFRGADARVDHPTGFGLFRFDAQGAPQPRPAAAAFSLWAATADAGLADETLRTVELELDWHTEPHDVYALPVIRADNHEVRMLVTSLADQQQHWNLPDVGCDVEGTLHTLAPGANITGTRAWAPGTPVALDPGEVQLATLPACGASTARTATPDSGDP